MQKWNMRCVAVQSAQDTRSTYGIVQRTESDWVANAIWLGGGRKPAEMCRPQMYQQSKQRECPTEHAEHTEPSGRESLPQIDTDAHRLGGYGIPAIPTPPITQPNILCIPWIPWENTTTLITKQTGRECPTEYAEHTEPSGREAPPTDCTDVHRLGATNAT